MTLYPIISASYVRTQKIFLVVIVLLAFILRFWHFDQRYGIGYDGSRDALVAFESARQLQLPLTGSFSSIGPITFGPWYYYYITFANFLIPSIWAPWIAIGLASLGMVLAMYKIGSLLINSTFGILLAFIAAVSPAQVSAATALQQHALIGLLSSLILYLFIHVSMKNATGKISVLWGFLTGVAINTHFQSTGLLALPVIYFLFAKKKRFIFSFLLGLFISMVPILIFELNNHWFNTKNIIDYIFIGQYRVWTSNRWLTFVGQFWPSFWSYATGLPIVITTVIMFTTGLLFIKKFAHRKLPVPFIIIGLSFIIQIVLLRYYRGEKFFGYLQFFHPFLFIYTGYLLYLLLKRLKNKILICAFLFVYLIIVLPNSLNFLKPDEFNIETRKRLDFLVSNYPQIKFATFECKNSYERHRIQGLLLMFYMNKLYDPRGEKITIYNPTCNYSKIPPQDLDIVNITSLTDKEVVNGKFEEITPESVYTETVRWWFKEQP